MKFGAIVTATAGFLSVGLLALTDQQATYSSAESTKTINRSSQRASYSANYADPVVSSVVAQLEERVKNEPARNTASSAVLRDEIDILRQEKETLETQHIVLVKQIRELKIALKKARMAPNSSDLLVELETEKSIRAQVEIELDSAKRELAKKDQEIALASSSKGVNSAALDQCRAEIKKNQRIVEKLPEVHEKFYTLKEAAASTEASLRQCGTELANLKETSSSIPKLESEISEKQKAIASCNTELSSYKAKTQGAALLKQELIAAKNELLMKETELKVLRGASDPAKLAAIAKVKQLSKKEPQGSSQAAPAAAKTSSDLLLVEVVGSKVNLRSGPGTEHSPVMQVQQSTRLTVEAKQGDWYRVFTPTGSRAYVSADMVRTLDGGAKTAKKSLEPRTSRNKVAQDQQKLRSAAKDKTLVPFGVVNLSAGPGIQSEKRALSVLKKGIGKPNNPPKLEKATGAK